MADSTVEALLLGKLERREVSPLVKLNSMFFDNVQKLSSMEEFDRNFKKCENNEDRLRFCDQYFPSSEVLLSVFDADVLTFCSKNEDVSTKLRNRGNTYFRNRDFDHALRAYNLALCFAPQNSPALALGFANRSAVFLEMGHDSLLKNCSQDIAHALSHDYPLDSRAKLEGRRQKCLERIAAIEIADDRENFEAIQAKRIALFQLQSPSPLLPSAENFVQIASHPIRGRELIVTQDVPPGTTLVTEKPFSKMLVKSLEWDFQRCHNCLKVTMAGIPCTGCTFAMFCTGRCLNEAISSFHQYECPCWPYLYDAEAPRFVLLTLRLTGQLGPLGICRLFKNPDELQRFSDTGQGVYDPTSYSSVYHLVSHVKGQSDLGQFSNVLQTLLMSTILEKCALFWRDLEQPGFNIDLARGHLRALILHHLQNLPCNSLALEEVKGQRPPSRDAQSIRTVKLEQYASGVYPTISLINHSCDPNVTRFADSSNEGQMAIVTLKGLQAGEPLFTSYSKSFQDPLAERRQYLKDNYHFDCACQPCTEHWPQLTQLLTFDPKFRCHRCRSPIQRSGKCGSSKCKWKKSPKELASEFSQNVADFYASYDMVLNFQPISAMDKLTPVLAYFQNAVTPPSAKFVLAQETLKRALDLIVYF